MTGLHTWRSGDPGDWDGESVPAAFNGTAPDLTTWVYDAASGLLVQKKDHAGGGPVYAYHDSGLLQSRTWARRITTSYGWNPAGDLASVGYSDGTPGANRTHRRDGSLASVTDAAGTTTYGYSGAVATGESIQGGLLDGLTLSYPKAGGRRQSFTASLGGDTVSAMAYGYDSTGRLDSVGEAGIGFSADFGYLGNSDLPATTASKAGATTVLTGARAYDNAGRLASIGYARPGTGVVTSHAYTLDAADRRIRAEREDGTAWAYGYNDRDEVTSAVKLLPGEELLAGWQQEFQYDNLGNRKFARESGDASGANRRQLEYSANALIQYTQISHPGAFDVLGRAPSSVSVTVNGQPVARQGEFWRAELGGLPNALAAVWQPVQVDAVDPGAGPNETDLPARRSGHRFVPMAVETPFYDFDGNLVADARWNYLWDGENRLTEVTTAAPAMAAGVPRERYRYVYDSRSRRIARTAESGRSWCYAYDGNGNVSAVVDLADGAKVGRYDYDAFGRTIALWGDEGLCEVNVYRFSTKPLDGTGLYYYGFRYYMPETGRWLGRDPIEENGGVNLYGFVGNNGVGKWDILGLIYDVYIVRKATLAGHQDLIGPNFNSVTPGGNPVRGGLAGFAPAKGWTPGNADGRWQRGNPDQHYNGNEYIVWDTDRDDSGVILIDGRSCPCESATKDDVLACLDRVTTVRTIKDGFNGLNLGCQRENCRSASEKALSECCLKKGVRLTFPSVPLMEGGLSFPGIPSTDFTYPGPVR